MSSKFNIAFCVAAVILLILNIGQFFVWRGINISNSETYSASIAELNATLAAYGPDVTVYTVSSAVKAGDVVLEENIESFTIPSSVDNDQYVHSISELTDRVFKIAVNPGTPITTNMTMAEVIEDDMRDRDIVLDRYTVGLEIGDYIDVRITMPYGDDYVVIPHKRVYALGDNTVKLYLSEFEWFQYQGAMVDYYLNVDYGATIYADKYIEPGIQQAAVKYYAVPTNIAALIQKNPNIIDKAEANDLNTWRSAIEELLIIFRDEEDTVDSDGSKFNSGRTSYNEAVNSDRVTKAEEAKTAEGETVMEEEEELGEDFWEEDITTEVQDVTDLTAEEG